MADHGEYGGGANGPYRGVGPRGYQRSDQRIADEVCDRLTRSGSVDASDIEITVDQGEVTLTGTVHSRAEKRMAEDVAESVLGVRDVHNHLRVAAQPGGVCPPDAVTERAATAPEAVQVGLQVFGSEGAEAGLVKEVRGNDFLLDRPLARDVYVPFSAIRSNDGSRIVLDVLSDQIDMMDWEHPGLFERPR